MVCPYVVIEGNIMRKWFWSIIMAVVGFIVGVWWLREREVTTPALKSYDDIPPQPAEQQAPSQQPDDVPSETPDAETSAEPETAPDDLTQVNGIGPAFESALNEIGITTYAQLAEQTPAELAARLDARGISAERIERDGWIEQARQLVNE
jgi:predicted flap endonuclease-1-like 5' DNA nuclease